MKKIFAIAFLFLVILTVSCKKEDARKDVENSIKKIEYFNIQFDKFYSDGVISTDTVAGEKNSEYDKMKQIASEFYEIMNKINRTVATEKEDLKDGKTIGEYEQEYQAVLKEKGAELKSLAEKFEQNLEKLNLQN